MTANHTSARQAGPLLLLTALLAADPASALSLVGFNAGPFYSLVGTVDSPTAPIALQILLDEPTVSDTFIGIASSNPALLAVTAGGVTVAMGQAGATVLVSGLALGSATLTAAFGGTTASAEVSVVPVIPTVQLPPTAWLLAAGLGVLGAVKSRRAHPSP